jgi:ABC-2 type transport system permease protein
MNIRMGTWEGIRLTARRELVERTKRDRGFVISTIITLAILLAIIFLPRLFGVGDPDEFDVGLVGPASAPLGEVLAAQPTGGVEVRVRQLPDVTAAETAVRDGDLDLAVLDGRQLLAQDEVDDQLNVLVQAASRAVRAQQTLRSAGLGQGEIQAALAPPPLPVRSLDPVDEEAQAKRTIATVGVFLLYGQLVGYGIAVATGVVEEKASRVVEVLLAAVRPVQLLAGKVIGIGLVGLIQLAIIAAIALVAATATDVLSLPVAAWGTVGWVLLWFLLGYAFYASLFAVAGAVVSRQEEVQNTTTPLSLLLLGAFFLAFSALGDADSAMATVASYIPASAPLVVPLRMAAGEGEAWQVALSFGIMLVSIVVVVLLAARLYAGAVLRTGARVKLGDAWRGARRRPSATAGIGA